MKKRVWWDCQVLCVTLVCELLNLLQVVIPSLERLAKEGEEGRKRIAKYTKYLTIAFAFIEALGLYLTYKSPLTDIKEFRRFESTSNFQM